MYDRNQLPQIKNIKKFIEWLNKYHISWKIKSVELKKLDNLQYDFSKQKVESIKNSINNGNYEAYPIVVSMSGTIIDGHHRYQAYKELNIPIIKCLVVYINASKLLELM